MYAKKHEGERDEKEREREVTFTRREGLLNPIHSGHHVSSERGKEASFSSQQRKSKDQITRCCSRKLRTLRRDRGCDHPDKDGTRLTERGLFSAWTSFMAIKILQGSLMLL